MHNHHERKLDSIRAAFEKYDEYSTGSIDMVELGQLVRDLGGSNMDEDEVSVAMEFLAKDNCEKVTFVRDDD